MSFRECQTLIELQCKRNAELKEILRKMNLPTSGTKAQLIQRILAHTESHRKIEALELETQRLSLELEISNLEAEILNLSQPHMRNTKPVSSTPKLKIKKPVLPGPVNRSVQAQSSNFCIENNGAENIASLLASAINATKMPAPEPTVFNGNPLAYAEWKKGFARFIDSNQTLTVSDKLFYLKRYTIGKVRDLVDSYYALDTVEAYNELREIIDERYGHPFKIAQAYRHRLSTWPKLKANDTDGLQLFSDFLINCQTAMVSIPHLKVLNDYEQNKLLKSILPDWMARRWSREVVLYSDKNNDEYPPFSVFVKFVKSETKIACHPISEYGTPLNLSYDQHNQFLLNESVSHAVDHLSKPSYITSSPCVLCPTMNHRLYECPVFKSKQVNDRIALVKAQRRCYLCLNTNHSKINCKLKLMCKLCRKDHNTLLHRPKVADSSVLSESDTTHDQAAGVNHSAFNQVLCVGSSSSMVVPVYLSCEQDPDNVIFTYAMLDTQSSLSFVTNRVASQLRNAKYANTHVKLSTMTSTNCLLSCKRFEGLKVRGYNSLKTVNINMCYTTDQIPHNLSMPTQNCLQKWQHLQGVAHLFPPVFDVGVGMLIGFDCPEALAPLKSVVGVGNEPYAVETILGWSLVGDIATNSNAAEIQTHTHDFNAICHRSIGSEVETSHEILPKQVIEVLETGFNDPDPLSHQKMSQNDKTFLNILASNTSQEDDKFYSMPLPFVNDKPCSLPNNRSMALRRLMSLLRKLDSNPTIKQKYFDFMDSLFANDDAESVECCSGEVGRVWYLPHHGVTNPKKPDKLRVVFDASCVFDNACLNKSLLQGPDLNNSLIGVLCRFRERKVAVACDIERMFYRFKVDEEFRDFLRFLWIDSQGIVKDYRMTKHIFGATSSPGCSKYGLLQIAKDHGLDKPKAQWFIENCFYVDDGLFSCDSVGEAIQLLHDTATVLACGNLKLHKFMSNNLEVIKSFPEADCASDVDRLLKGQLTETALGISWSPVQDSFVFSISPKTLDGEITRRKILIDVASIFDPLGFLSPLVLVGRLILQSCCTTSEWDDVLPSQLVTDWFKWVKGFNSVDKITIPRCLIHTSSSNLSSIEIHTFADASSKGYGACAYIKAIDLDGNITCSLLFGKSRVVPLKGSIRMPRLELQASVLAAQIGNLMAKELSLPISRSYYYSDSKVVLSYIQNSSKRFSLYVANRVEKIRLLTDLSNWHYVASKDNPADIASRGCDASELLASNWFTGPEFLTMCKESVGKCKFDLLFGDPEVRTSALICHSIQVNSNIYIDSVKNTSDWLSALKLIAILLHTKITKWKSPFRYTVQNRQDSQIFLIKQLQSMYFSHEISKLSEQQLVAPSSSLYRLDPFLDVDGVLRVGGRLSRASMLEGEKHPIIIPKNTHVAKLIVGYYHQLCGHQGRGITMSYIRSHGFWIVNLNSVVSSYIYNCVSCRKLRRPLETQKTSDLPIDRVVPSAPFSYIGMDCFGPFEVKTGRRYVKRYGIIFVCMASRAVHVELMDDMSADSVINSLRCLFALRGVVKQIRCDRGTNFVGASNELVKNVMPSDHMSQFLLKNQCEFLFNFPNSSHMAGSWERLIGSFRRVLSGLLVKNKMHSLDETCVRTIFYEAMCIVNNRPISTIDPDGIEPLTPNHLLHMKTSPPLPPPGDFTDAALYSRKRWHKIQDITNQFWKIWGTHYIQSLQERKGAVKATKFQVNDVVLVKDEQSFRGDWPLGRIIRLIESEDGLVRKAKIKIGDRSCSNTFKTKVLERPIHKLVLLLNRY